MYDNDARGLETPDRLNESTRNHALVTDGGVRYRDLSAFQREILVTIASLQERPNGLKLRDELSDRLATEVHHSRLYGNLDELVNKGIVKKGQVTARENYYEVTSEGYNLLWEQSDRLKEVLSEAVVDELQEATESDEELRDVASATPEGSP